MIFEDATKEAFGYYASELKPKSNCLIVSACILCGEIKVIAKQNYKRFCRSCMVTINLRKLINAKQVHIATNIDIHDYGYYKQGFNCFGTQKWMLVERKKADAEVNKDAISVRGKKYYQTNKEKISIKAKEYNILNKEAISARCKAYREQNCEKIRIYSKAYREQNKAKLSAELHEKYSANPQKYIARTKAYNELHHELVRATNLRATRKYKASAKGRATRDKRDRDLNYVELLPVSRGFTAHHINNLYVVPIPREVHQNLSGYSRKKHRELVMEWINQNDFEMYNTCQFVLNGDDRE